MRLLLTALVLTAAAACAPTPSKTSNVTEAQIETCWKQAGIQGDLYKFMDPGSFDKLLPSASISEQQAARFNSCIGVS